MPPQRWLPLQDHPAKLEVLDDLPRGTHVATLMFGFKRIWGTLAGATAMNENKLAALADEPLKQPKKPRLLQVIGPRLITGASDDAPTGIATYSPAAAR